jgi:nicotinamidase-related amidase
VKFALIVIDMQERFYEDSSGAARESWDGAIEAVNAALELFRRKGLPVFVVEHMNTGEGFVPGAKGFETVPAVKLLPSEPRLRKEHGSAFAKTDLAERLRAAGADRVLLCGYCAEWCVLSTARGAEPEGFPAVILREGIASATPSRIPFVLDVNDSASLGAVEAFLG